MLVVQNYFSCTKFGRKKFSWDGVDDLHEIKGKENTPVMLNMSWNWKKDFRFTA